MANVCVITGGGSGMGLATAKFIDKETILVLTGRTVAKLEKAKAILEAEGHEVHLIACDVSSRKDVHELCLFAASLGTIRTVIHSAGLSPAMADPEKIIRVNAIGTKNVNMEFFKYMNDGGVIVDVASSSAYQAPGFLVKHQIYEMAEYREDEFMKHMVREGNLAPGEYNKSGLAYTMSKNFVVWYAQNMIDATCAHRMGKPEELGFAIATIADERNGYLCGIDVLIDGGASTGKLFKK